jgi:hypothetical protein
MKLGQGQATGGKPEAHEKSECAGNLSQRSYACAVVFVSDQAAEVMDFVEKPLVAIRALPPVAREYRSMVDRTSSRIPFVMISVCATLKDHLAHGSPCHCFSSSDLITATSR